MKLNSKMLGLVLSGILVVSLGVSCAKSEVTPDTKQEEIEQQVETPKENKEKKDEKAEVEKKDEKAEVKDEVVEVEKIEEIDLKPGVDILDKSLSNHFDDYSISYDNKEKVINLTISYDGLANDYTYADSSVIDEFEQMLRFNCISFKDSMSKVIGSNDFTFNYILLNDLNKDNILLIIKNGNITYSAK